MSIINKQLRHRNFTPHKLLLFGIASGIGAAITAGGTYLLTEKLNIYYVVSTLIAGGVSFMVKFVLNAVWTFNEK